MGQRNKTEPRNKPTYLWSINLQQRRQEYTKGERKDSLFNKWCWESWTAACNSMKLEHSLIHKNEMKSKGFKHLNIRQDTINILEKNIEKSISDINHNNTFLGQYPKAVDIKKNRRGT